MSICLRVPVHDSISGVQTYNRFCSEIHELGTLGMVKEWDALAVALTVILAMSLESVSLTLYHRLAYLVPHLSEVLNLL